MTHGQPLPPTIEIVDEPTSVDGLDCIVATSGSESRLLARFPGYKRKVLWLQENREVLRHPPLPMVTAFDLVLTNDAALIVELGSRARYLPLLGTWITERDASLAKTAANPVSMISDVKLFASGHRMRHEVAAALPPGSATYDGFGRLFSQPYLPSKLPALAPYKFTIVIEPAAYAHWFSEKLGDAFATRTIPLFWGCHDLGPLVDLGFKPNGMIVWHTIAGLRDYLDLIHAHADEWYADRLAAVEHNARRIAEIPSTEHILEPILRSHFGLTA